MSKLNRILISLACVIISIQKWYEIAFFQRSLQHINLAKYLEQNDDEQIRVGDLTEKIKDRCEPYTIKHMKKSCLKDLVKK